jgi:TolB protein
MPSWNPDGSKLVHTRAYDIYVMDSSGQDVVRLTQRSEEKGHPHYSPDGTRILFESLPAGVDPQIWVMNADGSGPRQLTRHGGVEPNWSPDGTKVVYTRYENQPTLKDGVLWIIDLEGGAERQLTFKTSTTAPHF